MAALPFTLGGIPIRLMAENSLTRMAEQSTNDRVLIILQLHGGNDGLNSIIPVEAYDEYYRWRANIAIPAKNSLRKMITLDSTLSSDSQVGLHPDMIAMKDLYDRGRMSIVQGYPIKITTAHISEEEIFHLWGAVSMTIFLQVGWVVTYNRSLLLKFIQTIFQMPR